LCFNDQHVTRGAVHARSAIRSIVTAYSGGSTEYLIPQRSHVAIDIRSRRDAVDLSLGFDGSSMA
jgi:hypothetical protein